MIGEQSQKCQIILLNLTCLFSRPADMLYHYGSSKPVVGFKPELSLLETWDSHAESSSLWQKLLVLVYCRLMGSAACHAGLPCVNWWSPSICWGEETHGITRSNNLTLLFCPPT
jgi:hypothetical protein